MSQTTNETPMTDKISGRSSPKSVSSKTNETRATWRAGALWKFSGLGDHHDLYL